jgi:hypothetical protein
MKQVDEMIAKLASKYHFSEDEARRFLDLPVEVKPKPSSKPPTKPTAGKAKPSPSSGDFPTPPKTSPSTTRAPSAYQNFVKAESAKVRDEIMAFTLQAKLERGQLQKELGARWKAMSAEEKSVYTK